MINNSCLQIHVIFTIINRANFYSGKDKNLHILTIHSEINCQYFIH